MSRKKSNKQRYQADTGDLGKDWGDFILDKKDAGGENGDDSGSETRGKPPCVKRRPWCR